MAPVKMWRKKTVSATLPSAVLQACTVNMIVAPITEDEPKSGLTPKEQVLQIADDGDSTDPGDSQSQNGSPSSTSSDHEASDQENAPLAPATPTSWSKMLQMRREAKKDGCADDDGVMRRVTSILNKLTVEKFESLYSQLVSCGISGEKHLEMLVQEISEKASTQPHFAAMYATLSVRLGEVLGEDTQGRDLGDLLLLQSNRAFEMLVQLPRDSKGEVEGDAEGEEEEEEKDADEKAMEESHSKQKARLLGNIRFTGELITRGIISSKIIQSWCKDLLQEPLAPTCLEALTILLTIVGPRFDTPANPMHRQLREVFWQIRGLTFDMGVPKRIRCLVRDVLDSKEAGWVDTRAARAEGPKRLREVKQEVQKASLKQHPPPHVIAPPCLTPVSAANAPMLMPMMAMSPMFAMPPMIMMPMMPAQPCLRAADPLPTKKKGIKLQNKALSKPVSDP